MKASILASIIVVFALGLAFTHEFEPVFAEETEIQAKLETIQNFVGIFDEKSFNERYLGKSLFDIIKIGNTIDDAILEINDPRILTHLIILSNKYNQNTLSFLDKVSSELEKNNSSSITKKLVAETKLFVINTDFSINKKIETFETDKYVNDELERLESEDRFQEIHQKTVIEDSKFGYMKDPLIDTIVKVTESKDYDLAIVGLKKLDIKTENYDDGTIHSSIDNSLKLFYELQSVNGKINSEKEKLREEFEKNNYQEGYHIDLDWSDLEDLKLLQIEIINQLELGVIDVIQNVDEQKMKVDEEMKLKIIQEDNRDRKSNEYNVDTSDTDNSKDNNNNKDKDKKDKDN